ncbi:MAG: F0F1 ATP synthase subunit B [bacterium]
MSAGSAWPLGFKPEIFFFSIVNFGILFFLLKRFLFKPVHGILEERKAKIKEGLDQVELVKKEREGMVAEKEKIILEARKESEKIVTQADKMKKEIISCAQEEAGKMVKQVKAEMEKEREILKREMYLKLFDLVTMASEKAFANISKQEKHTKLIETAILESLKDPSVGFGGKSIN